MIYRILRIARSFRSLTLELLLMARLSLRKPLGGREASPSLLGVSRAWRATPQLNSGVALHLKGPLHTSPRLHINALLQSAMTLQG